MANAGPLPPAYQSIASSSHVPYPDGNTRVQTLAPTQPGYVAETVQDAPLNLMSYNIMTTNELVLSGGFMQYVFPRRNWPRNKKMKVKFLMAEVDLQPPEPAGVRTGFNVVDFRIWKEQAEFNTYSIGLEGERQMQYHDAGKYGKVLKMQAVIRGLIFLDMHMMVRRIMEEPKAKFLLGNGMNSIADVIDHHSKTMFLLHKVPVDSSDTPMSRLVNIANSLMDMNGGIKPNAALLPPGFISHIQSQPKSVKVQIPFGFDERAKPMDPVDVTLKSFGTLDAIEEASNTHVRNNPYPTQILEHETAIGDLTESRYNDSVGYDACSRWRDIFMWDFRRNQLVLVSFLSMIENMVQLRKNGDDNDFDEVFVDEYKDAPWAGMTDEHVRADRNMQQDIPLFAARNDRQPCVSRCLGDTYSCVISAAAIERMVNQIVALGDKFRMPKNYIALRGVRGSGSQMSFRSANSSFTQMHARASARNADGYSFASHADARQAVEVAANDSIEAISQKLSELHKDAGSTRDVPAKRALTKAMDAMPEGKTLVCYNNENGNVVVGNVAAFDTCEKWRVLYKHSPKFHTPQEVAAMLATSDDARTAERVERTSNTAFFSADHGELFYERTTREGGDLRELYDSHDGTDDTVNWQRAFRHLLLCDPFDITLWRECIRWNVDIPFTIAMFRPNVTFCMMAAVLVRAGETAEIIHAWGDTGSAQDEVQKSDLTHVRVERAYIVKDRRSLVQLHGVKCNKYLAGGATDFVAWKNLPDLRPATTRTYGSIVSFGVPASTHFDRWFDMTGEWSERLREDYPTLHARQLNDHYPGCRVLRARMDFDADDDNTRQTPFMCLERFDIGTGNNRLIGLGHYVTMDGPHVGSVPWEVCGTATQVHVDGLDHHFYTGTMSTTEIRRDAHYYRATRN